MTGTSRVGVTLGEKYVLSRLLGVGGMGEVYEATNTAIDRRVAIKLLRPEVATDPTILERFKNEARAAGRIDNEHIAAALDFGIAEDGAPFIVMELLKGENLATLLAREGPLPVPRATDIVIQASRGLSAAHEIGIVHRDLKPENLFVSQRADGADLVKVLDFGIAKLQVGGAMTRPGLVMGTPRYMPPEQFVNFANVGPPGDVYGLAVILYEALTKKEAHPGVSYYEVMHHVMNIDPPTIETLCPGFPPGLSSIISKAMARKADHRFLTVKALREALEPFAEDLSKRGRQHRSFPTGATVGLGFAALAFAGWTLWPSGSRERTASRHFLRDSATAPIADAGEKAASPAPDADTPTPLGLTGPASTEAVSAGNASGRPGGRPGGRPQAARLPSMAQKTRDVPLSQTQASGRPPAHESKVLPPSPFGSHLAPDQEFPENPVPKRVDPVYPGNE